jgi:hypothetical protein
MKNENEKLKTKNERSYLNRSQFFASKLPVTSLLHSKYIPLPNLGGKKRGEEINIFNIKFNFEGEKKKD